uniref:Uncharacterized protein n=1 Tax=Rhizophora mucronata TaxID=61149 RepID=A0A2P2MZ90_RHIMU
MKAIQSNQVYSRDAFFKKLHASMIRREYQFSSPIFFSFFFNDPKRRIKEPNLQRYCSGR